MGIGDLHDDRLILVSHGECVQQLLDAGAEPNIKNIREETALDHAAQYGRQVGGHRRMNPQLLCPLSRKL